MTGSISVSRIASLRGRSLAGEVMNKLGASLIGSLLFAGALALTGCNSDTGTAGSGNVLGSSTTGPGTGPGSGAVPGPTGTRVQVIPSSPQMPSSGATTVDLTAIALDAGGQALAGVTITLSTGTDPSAFISNITGGGVSDANGTVTAKLNLGFNRANRLITVSASAQGATANANVDVTGTAITVSGSSSLAFGAQTTLTFSLKDSAGVALPGFAMTIASAAGNGISPATGTTNSAGQVAALVTANVGGSDTITATAAGASKTQSLTVSGAGFAFTTPAPSVDIPLNTATPVVVHWTASGAPVVGQTVSFSTSRGNLAGNPATTDGAGNASVSISSPSAGPATITASGPNNTPSATLDVVFVATTASSIAVQAVPSTVQVTTGVPSQTNNSSTISVVVRDAQNNLVKNASVTFTLTADPSGGGLTTSTATTDVTISATVSQVGGVAIPPVTGGTALTVSGQSLLVRLGTDNLVQSVPPLLKKTWAAFVTDAAGNAVVGATVRFALRPGRFEKGFYFVPAPPAAQRWTQAVTAICPNEDLNFNGIVDPGEDTNGNGSLEPPGVTTVNATATTDSTGVALAVLTYPKDHATWTEVILEARSGVAGNDPPATATFFLPGLASDYIDVSVSPPGQLSPYGQNNNCASPL